MREICLIRMVFDYEFQFFPDKAQVRLPPGQWWMQWNMTPYKVLELGETTLTLEDLSRILAQAFAWLRGYLGAFAPILSVPHSWQFHVFC